MTTSTTTTKKVRYNFDSIAHHFPCRVEVWAAAWFFALWRIWPAGVWWGRRQRRWPRGWPPPGTPAPPHTGSKGDLPQTSLCSGLCGVMRGQNRSKKAGRSSQYCVVWVRKSYISTWNTTTSKYLHGILTTLHWILWDCTVLFVSQRTDRYWSVRPRPEPGRWQRRSWGPTCRRVWPPTRSSGWG